MNLKLAELARRREILISRSAAQREELAQAYQDLRRPLQIVKMMVGLAQTLAAHPELAAGLGAFFIGSGRWRKLPLQLWMGWQALRPLRFLWSKLNR
jgi:hypothetical protein